MIFWVGEAVGTPNSPGEPWNPFAADGARQGWDGGVRSGSGAVYEGAKMERASGDGEIVLREHVFRVGVMG